MNTLNHEAMVIAQERCDIVEIFRSIELSISLEQYIGSANAKYNGRLNALGSILFAARNKSDSAGRL